MVDSPLCGFISVQRQCRRRCTIRYGLLSTNFSLSTRSKRGCSPAYFLKIVRFPKRFSTQAPNPLARSFAGCLCTSVPNGLRRCISHLDRLIEERLELQTQHGERNDPLSLLLDANQTKPFETSLLGLVLNFAAIHTSAMRTVHA